jgi:hypothetical protein
MDFLLKLSFAYALISRFIRNYVKSKREFKVEVNLPEGIKFLLTWVFIYIFAWVFADVYLALVLIFNKIIG